MAEIDRVNLDNTTTYDIISKTGRGLVRATMNTSTSTSTAFVVTADSGIESLYDGLTIVVKNTKIASASGCTLDLNGLGAKSIWLSQSNSACTTHWGLNQTYLFVYDATNTRWELQQGRDTDSNTQDVTTLRTQYSNPTTGVNGVKKYSLFARTEDSTYTSFTSTSGTGAKTYDTTTKFDLRKIFYYIGSSDVATNTALANNSLTYAIASIDLRYTLNGITTDSTSTLAAKDPVYLIVEPCGNRLFKLTQPYYTKAPLSVTNGFVFVYVLIGYMRDTYRVDLLIDNSMCQWNEDGTKLVPYVEGEHAVASGNNSHAEGLYTVASNQASHAEGYSTIASGYQSHAEGTYTKATENSTHAEGYQTTANGAYSHAEGSNTIAQLNAAHSEGLGTLAYEEGCHSEGSCCISGAVPDTTIISRNLLHWDGEWSSENTYDVGSIVYDAGEIYVCKVAVSVARITHPEYDSTYWVVYRDSINLQHYKYAHVEGYKNIALGTSSHVEGEGNFATGDYTHISGKYAKSTAGAEVVGGGTESSKKDIRILDWNGNESIAGNLEFMESSNTGSNIPGIYWKELGYGDAFKIVPQFSGTGDQNYLTIKSSTGGSGETPVLSDSHRFYPSGGIMYRGTCNSANSDVDVSQSNNGLSSNKYVGSYFQDVNNRSFGKFTSVALTDGTTALEMYTQNFNTSGASVGSNTLTMYMNKSGTASCNFSHPWAWLAALGMASGFKCAFKQWQSSVKIRQCGGDWMCIIMCNNSIYTIRGGGGNHATMTPSFQLVAGNNESVTQSISHSTNYSEFTYSRSSNAGWVVLSFSSNWTSGYHEIS